MDAAMHLLVGRVGVGDGDGFQTLFCHHRALAEQGDIVRLPYQSEQQVDGVHLYLDSETVVCLRYGMLKGAAGLCAFLGEGKVVFLKFLKGNSRTVGKHV